MLHASTVGALKFPGPRADKLKRAGAVEELASTRIYKQIDDSIRHRLGQRAPEVGAPQFRVDPRKRLVSVKFRRKVTVGAIESYAALLRANPLFKPDFSEIVDMTEVEELDLKPEEFIRLADEVDPFSIEARRTFVVRNEIQHHAARMHKILRTQRDFSIFDSVEEAQRWLGL